MEKAIENTAEAVDKIAGEAEKVMEQVEHDLPEGSQLKETVLMLEHATEEAQKDAKLAIDLIHKVPSNHQIFWNYTIFQSINLPQIFLLFALESFHRGKEVRISIPFPWKPKTPLQNTLQNDTDLCISTTVLNYNQNAPSKPL